MTNLLLILYFNPLFPSLCSLQGSSFHKQHNKSGPLWLTNLGRCKWETTLFDCKETWPHSTIPMHPYWLWWVFGTPYDTVPSEIPVKQWNSSLAKTVLRKMSSPAHCSCLHTNTIMIGQQGLKHCSVPFIFYFPLYHHALFIFRSDIKVLSFQFLTNIHTNELFSTMEGNGGRQWSSLLELFPWKERNETRG